VSIARPLPACLTSLPMKNAARALAFLLQFATLGLAIAFVVTRLWPGTAERLRGESAPAPAAATPAPPTPAAPTFPAAPAANGAGPVSYADAVARAAPAVVNIYANKVVTQRTVRVFPDPTLQRLFGALPGPVLRRREQSLGSGVIVSADGYVLTNYHVIAAADDIQILLYDGRVARALVVGSDEDTDLAVLKIDASNLPTITLDPAVPINVGDVVLAIGNPFGVGQTVTMGIVSALGRSIDRASLFGTFIQTDAAINPGNSGGALVDAEGRLIGINTAIYSRSGGSMGIGFAIPVDTARSVVQALLRDGQVTRGWIGVEPRDLSPELAASLRLTVTQGVLITGVLQDGPASRGGMRPGDVVVAIGGTEVLNTAELLAAVAALQPQSVASVAVQRGAQALQLNLTVAQRPKPLRRSGE